MSTQLIYTLEHLRGDGIISKFQCLTGEYARIYLPDGQTYTVFIANNRYLIGIVEIQEALTMDVPPDYIVYSMWHQVTEAARDACQEKNISLLNYFQFRNALQKR